VTSATDVELFSFDEPRTVQVPRLGYRPALDGVRAVAVLGVLLYHQNPARLPGGFLGVDVFFVLSGFLITGIVLGENSRDGRLDLRRFWLGRARRLLPALLLTILLVSAYARWLASPESLADLRGDGLAALAYVVNWRFVLEGRSYFFEFFPSPLRHLWSLAVEEQWYLVWPFVLWVILRGERARTARGLHVVLGLSLVLAVASASAMAALHTPGADPSRVYYGTDTHGFPLLFGAALAAAWALWPRITAPVGWPATATIGLLGAAGIGWCFVQASGTAGWLYPGGFLMVSAASLAVLWACSVPDASTPWHNPVASMLALAPLRGLGKISYGVYLFHWPLWFFITPERTDLTGARLFALRFVVTVVAATVSYVAIERPIRQGALREMRLSPVVLSAAVVLVVAALLASTAGATAPWLTRDDLDVADRPAPALAPVAPGTPAEERSSRVLLVGDSVAYTLGIGFEGQLGRDERLAVWNQAVLYCELVGLPRRENAPDGEVKEPSDSCDNWQGLWGTAVEQYDPEVSAVLIGPWEIFDRRDGDAWAPFGSPESDALLRPQLDALLTVLSSRGGAVVLLTASPLDRTDGVSAREWTLDERERIEHLNGLLADAVDDAAARGIDASVVNLASFVCPGEDGCRRDVAGTRIRGDGIHFTDDGSVVAAAWLAPQLRELALETARRRDEAATPPP